MRLLYTNLLQDMHLGLQCFWSRKRHEYNQSITVDAMFPQSGWFYGTLRQLMLDVSKVNDLARLGVSFEAPRNTELPAAKKGKWQDRRSGSSGGPSSSKAPSKAKVGSFAWAVKEDGDTLTVGYTKYAQKLILAKLNLQSTEICLPSYLSWKGAEACPCPTKEGHEEHDSTYHLFTEAQLALRPTFEEEPYKLPMDAQDSPAGRGAGKGKGAGRAGQGGRK